MCCASRAGQAITFAHMAAIVPVVFLLFGADWGWRMGLAIPGVAVLAFNVVWVSALLGMIVLRYRDVPQIVGASMQVLFFLTPVFWHPSMVGKRGWIATLNPLFAQIDVIRAPLLGVPTSFASWWLLLAVALVGSVTTFLLFARLRARLVYWA